MSIELMGGDIQAPDERRQKLLDSLAKARAVRAAKAAERKAQGTSDEDQAEYIMPRKKPKKLTGKRALNAAVAEKRRKPATLPPGWTDGLSGVNCAIACEADKCCITGENVCGHPAKGGLQGKYMHDKDVLRRFGEARQHIAHLEAESGTKKRF